MKNIFTILTVFLFCTAKISGQNVGVGTNAPHPSAKLHIDANNAGILIPSLNLSATTFPSPGPATGLLVYNSNASYGGGIGFYFNSGTPASPVWFKILDQTNSMTPDQDWFEANSTTAPDNISDNIYTQGNVGIGDFSSSAPTSRLDIKDVIDGGNAINLNMTDGVAANSVGLNINSFAANANSRAGVSINMANTSNSAGIRIANIGATGMNGILVDADANGNGIGIRLGETTTLGTGINIRGGTGVLYNALSSGDGTGIRIGGTTVPQKGVEANAVYSTGTGLIGGVSTVGSPTSPVRTGVFGYATSNSTTGTDIQHGRYFSIHKRR
jgi:trimeric autotransporter adhesin